MEPVESRGCSCGTAPAVCANTSGVCTPEWKDGMYRRALHLGVDIKTGEKR